MDMKIVLTLCTLIAVGAAFECYSGQYAKEQKKPPGKESCAEGRCIKILVEKEGKLSLLHGCLNQETRDRMNRTSSLRVSNDCEYEKSANGHSSTCFCNTDLCNGAQQQTLILPSLALMGLAKILL